MPSDLTYDVVYLGGWANEPTETTPTSAQAFQHMDDGIAAASARAGVSVRFDDDQTLTAPEKLQALRNIAALGSIGTLVPGSDSGISIDDLLDEIAAHDARALPLPGSGDAGKVLTVKPDHSGYELDTPSGGSAVWAEQLDYACDLSGVATTIPTTGSSLDVAGGLGLSVPATAPGRSLILRCGGAAQITAAGAGMIGLQIYETTAGGAGVLVGVSQITGTFTVGSGSAFPSFPSVSYDLGPSSTERQFKLMCAMIRDASSSLAANVRSTTTGVVRAWIEAVAM